MNRIVHDIIAWITGMAIGIKVGKSLNNVALGIGLGVAISAGIWLLPK